jgi:nucleotide-binding universal stress UspA family protein
MKTIAVLTNFSDRAENAAVYALHLAQRLRANVMIYNSFLLPSSQPFASQIAWPMESFDDIRGDCDTQLALLAGKLTHERSLFPADSFQPEIERKSEQGKLSEHLAGSLADSEIFLLAMADHAGGLATILQGNNMKETIENTALPILIIPEGQLFKPIKKIAFATDLSDSDLLAIHTLVSFARPFQAEIMLTHICADPLAKDAKKKVADFLAEVTNKINYPHIYYRAIANGHVKKALTDLSDQVTIDLLVMVHRNKGFFAQLFNTSNTEKIAAEIKLPLLIYPSS